MMEWQVLDSQRQQVVGLERLLVWISHSGRMPESVRDSLAVTLSSGLIPHRSYQAASNI